MKQTLENFQELSTNQIFLEYIAKETPYTYSRTLQKSSASILYLLENRRTHEKVVLKRMRKRTLKRPKYKARYMCECDALARLHVPELPTLLNEGMLGRVPFQIMTYMKGAPLADRIPYRYDEAVMYVKRVGDILSNMHTQGFIHGHVTAEHVIVNGDTLQLVGLDHVSTLVPHETLPYKTKTIAYDIAQLARLFLMITDTTKRFKWKKATQYVAQMVDSPLKEVCMQALDQHLFDNVPSFIDALQRALPS